MYDPVNLDTEVNSELKHDSTSQITPQVNTDLQLKVLELELKLQSSEEKVSSLQKQLEKTEGREERLRLSHEKLTDTIGKQTLLISDMSAKAPERATEKKKGFFGRLVS